jgi:hypothetical protein
MMLKKIWNHNLKFIFDDVLIRVSTVLILLVMICSLMGGVVFFTALTFFLSMTLHELGHMLAIKLVGGGGVNELKIGILEAYVKWEYDAAALSNKDHVIVSLAGPLANVIIAMIAWTVLQNPYAQIAIIFNTILAFTNLSPIGFSDGHQAISIMLHGKMADNSFRRIRVSVTIVIQLIACVWAAWVCGILIVHSPAGFAILLLIIAICTLPATLYLIRRENKLCQRMEIWQE